MATPSEPHYQRILEVVIRCAAATFKVPPDELLPTTHFSRDLGVDSLDFVSLIIDLEEELKLTVSDDTAHNNDVTAAQLAEKLCKLIA